jgi:hypothetical protein
MVFGAFAPTVSKLLDASQSVTWLEVCTTQGTQRIAVDLGGKTAPKAPHLADNHCGYCLLQHHSPFIPVAFVAWAGALLAAGRLRLGAGGTTIFKRFERDAHQTRAPPPAFS